MSSQLITFAHQLAVKRGELAEAQLFEWQAERDAERRRLELTPPEGWPGKNDAERKAAAGKVYAADAALSGFEDDAARGHAAGVRAASGLAALEDLRRASEWNIREALVNALSRREIAPSGSGRAPDHGFDDAADEYVYDQAAGEEVPF